MVRFLWYSFLFAFLTALTQIGGVIFLFSLAIASLIKREFKLKKLVVFLSIYLLSTLLIVPLIAPKFGRERIKSVTPASYFTILANRNYVTPEMNVLLKDLQDKLGHVNYLDANFPFIDKFPLLPHLSHNDGKKLDLSLAYETSDRTEYWFLY